MIRIFFVVLITTLLLGSVLSKNDAPPVDCEAVARKLDRCFAEGYTNTRFPTCGSGSPISMKDKWERKMCSEAAKVVETNCQYACTQIEDPQIWPDDFKWSFNEPTVDNDNCLEITRNVKYTTTAMKNYLCWDEHKASPGLKWSSNGTIDDMRCTLIFDNFNEPQQKQGSQYLCVPHHSPLNFMWSSRGTIPGLACMWSGHPECSGTWFDYLGACPESEDCHLDAPKWPEDFYWMEYADNDQRSNSNCVEIKDPLTTTDGNYRYLCWNRNRADPGIVWSTNGTLSDKRCTEIPKLASVRSSSMTWSDNYICVPLDSTLDFKWSPVGNRYNEIPCLPWLGRSIPHLCTCPENAPCHYGAPSWPDDFKWSTNGPAKGYHCIRIYVEYYDDTDDYLCWNEHRSNPGIIWSNRGQITNTDVECTKINSTLTNSNTFLCLPMDSHLNFTWSTVGTNSTASVNGLRCMEWTGGFWGGQYLCATSEQYLPRLQYEYDFQNYNENFDRVPSYNCVNTTLNSTDMVAYASSGWCWSKNSTDHDLGFKWSNTGAIAGMRCTPWNPDLPGGNSTLQYYLCLPSSSSLQLRSSSNNDYYYYRNIPGWGCQHLRQYNSRRGYVNSFYLCGYYSRY